jgi:hypothetical protein
MLAKLRDYLGDPDHMLEESDDSGSSYVHPTRKNAGVVTLALVREIIAPAIFRHEEEEIADIEHGDETIIRATPLKFKHGEKARGLQILRWFGVGGRYPHNRTALPKNGKPSDAFDLNTLVFGDSLESAGVVMPVKAGVLYSDALSLRPKHEVVGESFHNRAGEEGVLFDPESKRNSRNLFTQHFIRPGCLLVQLLTTTGRVLPPHAIDHLLLSIGLAGAAGGRTSVTGINTRTHLAGIFAGRYERPAASPYVLRERLLQRLAPEDLDRPEAVCTVVETVLGEDFVVTVPAAQASAHRDRLLADFESDAPGLRQRYAEIAGAVTQLLDRWFTNDPGRRRGESA